MTTGLIDILLPYQKKFFLAAQKRKIWISSRQIGKSFDIAAILCFKALQKPNGLSLCISTGARASSEIIKKCAQFAEAIKLLSNGEIDYGTSFDQVKFSNGSRVISLPGSTDGANLRGYTAQCVCCDEACFIRNLEDIVQGIAPTLTRDPDAELIFTTTPGGKNGYFYKMYQDALQDPAWYVQETTIHDAIADGLKVDLAALRQLCPDPDRFAQEYECKWLSEYSSFIDTSLVDWYDESPKASTWYCGMDIGSTSDKTAIASICESNGALWLDDIVVMRKASYQQQLDILKQLNQQRYYKAGLIDQTGIGSALAEFATRQVSSLIKGLQFTSANKTPMFEQLRAKIFQHKLKVNSKFKAQVIADFNNVSRVVNEAGQVKYQAGRDENGHSDITSAIVLALEAARQHPVSATQPAPVPFSSAFGSRFSRL